MTQHLSNLAADSTTNAPGCAYLVGAGPGDPGLLTLRGKECLELADVVLYDGLANSQLLSFAPQAEWICVGKHGQTPLWTQTDINSRLLELVQAGNQVVRLKGGDPAVFARTAEELEVLAAANVPFEVVPGITAALAAASYVGIPITHRSHASAVAFVTGQQQTQDIPQPIDWQSLARFPGTLVFYMGVTTVKQWTEELLCAGKDPKTPTAIIRRCTWSDQKVIRCPLSGVVEQLTPASKLRPPVIVIVGEVANLGREFDWFSQRPLLGVGVLVTRPQQRSASLGRKLQSLGAEVFYQPAMEIGPAADASSMQALFRRLQSRSPQDAFVGLTFSSANSVECFMQRLFETGQDARLLARVKLAVVGPGTAAALAPFGIRADIQPDHSHGFSAAGLLQKLRTQGAWCGAETTWYVTGSNTSSPELANGLRKEGCIVEWVETYHAEPIRVLSEPVKQALLGGRIHFCTVTSSATAQACTALLSSCLDADEMHRIRPVALGRKVAAVLDEDVGWGAVVKATEHTDEALVDALLATVNASEKSMDSS